MKNKGIWILTTAIVVLISYQLSAQTVWISDKSGPIDAVDLYEAELQDNQKLLSQTRSENPKDGPLTFAKTIRAKIKSETEGTWESLETGQLIWRQRIKSEGAYSLNLGFENFQLPESAAMFLYNVDKTYVIGPITAEDNEVHKEWWSPIIPFEEVVIEIQIDPSERKYLKTEITSIQHDFIGFGNLLSGSCNVDVVCGADDDLAIIDQYRDIINSVGMYSINGRDLCSGNLINNTSNDCTPYFLTAQHCGVTQSNAATVVVYWNYQNSTCRTPGSGPSGTIGDGPRAEFNSGTSLIAEHDRTDFALLLLDDRVDPATQPYFAGWNRTDLSQDTVLSIHHPNTEEKRISFDFDVADPYVLDVFYRIYNWDIGTTEGGSSGSPLFTTQGRVIGQLNGGFASCTNSNNTDETDDYDDYGMLSLSWNGGGTPETRLRDWLDPSGTNAQILDGRGCSDLVLFSTTSLSFCTLNSNTETLEVELISGFENGADIVLVNATEGIEVNFPSPSISPEAPEAIIEIIITENFEGENAAVSFSIGDDLNQDTYRIQLNINPDIPTAPQLKAPEDNTQNASFEINLQWSGDGDGYQIEISPDANFENEVILIEEVVDTSLLIRSLESRTNYFWRVRGGNSCGTGDYSSIFQFTTGNIQCEARSASDLPQEISDNVDTVVSTILIESVGNVVDVNVTSIIGTHTYIGDLDMFLTSPQGTRVQLLSGVCDDNDDFSIGFDDSSEIINRPCPLTSSSAMRPDESLAIFQGEDGAGEWTLTIIDDVFLDGGSLESWSLELCQVNAQMIEFSIDQDTIDFCALGKDPIELTGSIGAPFAEEVTLSILNDLDNAISTDINIDPATGSGSRAFTITINEYDDLRVGEFFSITADDGINNAVETIYLNGIVPGSFELSTPADGLTGVSRTPSLSWGASENATSYQVFVALDSNISQLVLDTIVSSVSITLSESLEKETNYYWQVNALNDCITTSSEVSMFVTDLTDPTIDLTLEAIQIFPNPTSDIININRGNLLAGKILRVELINAQGQLLMQKVLDKEDDNMNLQDIQSGVYFLKLSSQDGILTQPIIKL